MNLKEGSLLKFYYLATKHLNLLILKVFSISPASPQNNNKTKQAVKPSLIPGSYGM